MRKGLLRDGEARLRIRGRKAHFDMSKAKKRAVIQSDSDDSGSSDIEQVCGDAAMSVRPAEQALQARKLCQNSGCR